MNEPAPAQPVFEVIYWGATGTMAAPLLPAQATEKLVESVARLIEQGALAGLAPGPRLRAAVAEIVERHLPFHLRSTYGGNTTCIEIQTPDGLIIFDCGSGLRELGHSLLERWRLQGQTARRSADILISHAHMDHTFGTPYFIPYYDGGCCFQIHALQSVIDSLTAVLSPDSALSRLYFPPTFSEMKSTITSHSVLPGDDWWIGSTHILTYPLNHPGGALAFRIENSGRAIVLASDHEHLQAPDPDLAHFARGADLLYMDGQYREAEYLGKAGIGSDPGFSRINWGHSPMESCVKTAVAAGAGLLHVGHREPRRADAGTAAFEEDLRRLTAAELAARKSPGRACSAAVPYEGMRALI
jgi:phosphoribosyl 1,2-cyclic phosphodiesterase